MRLNRDYSQQTCLNFVFAELKVATEVRPSSALVFCTFVRFYLISVRAKRLIIVSLNPAYKVYNINSVSFGDLIHTVCNIPFIRARTELNLVDEA